MKMIYLNRWMIEGWQCLALAMAVLIAGVSGLTAGHEGKEIWYNAAGDPVLVIDKKTGKRLPVSSVVAENDAATRGEREEKSEVVPSMLSRKFSENGLDSGYVMRWSPRRRNVWRSRYSYSGYPSFRVVPRFSHNGYYGPVRYAPTHGGGHGYYRGHGFFLRYHH